MINNRQNGRRRGRGGPQVRGGPGNGQDRGNRIDNRARGNAAQLHEKYRNLARDTQTQGDRVMTEYYLQFADHYFRVLSESRARFEEQNPNQVQARPRRDEGDFYDGLDQDEGEEGFEGDRYDRRPQRQDRPERPVQQDRPERAERPERQERAERPERQERPERTERQERQPEPAREPQVAESIAAETGDAGETQRPRRGRRPRRTEADAGDQPQRIEVDRLPPALASEAEPAANGNGADAGEAVSEEAPKRRRTRRVKDDGDSSVAAA